MTVDRMAPKKGKFVSAVEGSAALASAVIPLTGECSPAWVLLVHPFLLHSSMPVSGIGSVRMFPPHHCVVPSRWFKPHAGLSTSWAHYTISSPTISYDPRPGLVSLSLAHDSLSMLTLLPHAGRSAPLHIHNYAACIQAAVDKVISY